MYVVNAENKMEFEVRGARKVRVKYLLHAGIGAKRIQLRLFNIDIGGCTPLERHEHEHEVYMLEGKAVLRGEDGEVEVGRGDAIFIPSNELHQFRNTGIEAVRFLCTKETQETPEPLRDLGK